MTAPLRLVDPDDAALCAAFAERVDGWRHVRPKPSSPTAKLIGQYSPIGGKSAVVPEYTSSMDAVLPNLEKYAIETTSLWHVTIAMTLSPVRWTVRIGKHEAHDPILPRACVLALLRAHGVSVEFTK